MKTAIAAAAALMLGGCAVSAVQARTLVVPPRDEPTTVTAECVGTSTDYFLVHVANARVTLTEDTAKPAQAKR